MTDPTKQSDYCMVQGPLEEAPGGLVVLCVVMSREGTVPEAVRYPLPVRCELYSLHVHDELINSLAAYVLDETHDYEELVQLIHGQAAWPEEWTPCFVQCPTIFDLTDFPEWSEHLIAIDAARQTYVIRRAFLGELVHYAVRRFGVVRFTSVLGSILGERLARRDSAR